MDKFTLTIYVHKLMLKIVHAICFQKFQGAVHGTDPE